MKHEKTAKRRAEKHARKSGTVTVQLPENCGLEARPGRPARPARPGEPCETRRGRAEPNVPACTPQGMPHGRLNNENAAT